MSKSSFSFRVRPLTILKKSSSGRNSSGRITVYHRGGRSKVFYRILCNSYSFLNVPALVFRSEYDPNRNADLYLLVYRNGYLGYTLKTLGVSIGSLISVNTSRFTLTSGSSFPVGFFPLSFSIHSLENFPGSGTVYARSSGNYATLVKQNVGPSKKYSLIRLPSGSLHMFLSTCFATYGKLANSYSKVLSVTKAGTIRRLGRRPSVRGVAMNPIDHPHGGGQGKTSGGRPSVTPWGVYTKGAKTRSSSRTNKFIIASKK
jgi:large subunit ribosomal protein L2